MSGDPVIASPADDTADDTGLAGTAGQAVATEPWDGRGRRIVVANGVGTAVFVATATLAAAIFTTPFQWLGAITALTLFAIGVFSFLWSYFHAVNRSRLEEIGTAQLYLLTGPPSPKRVKRAMLAMLVVQALTALITTLIRPNGPDGRPGSSLAVGFLAAMLGFGLNGLWTAFHGVFPPRRRVDDERPVDATGPAGRANPGTDPGIGQNGEHG